MPANRDKLGRFVKGQSGNPSGRPPIPAAQKELLRNLVPEALEIKRMILADADAPLSLKNQVADSILDRVYGKPTSDTTGDDSAVNKIDLLIRSIDNEAKQ